MMNTKPRTELRSIAVAAILLPVLCSCSNGPVDAPRNEIGFSPAGQEGREAASDSTLPELTGFAAVKPGARKAQPKSPPPSNGTGLSIDARAEIGEELADPLSVQREGDLSVERLEDGRHLAVLRSEKDARPLSTLGSIPSRSRAFEVVNRHRAPSAMECRRLTPLRVQERARLEPRIALRTWRHWASLDRACGRHGRG